uniref:Uncharacterized protein n=2 Tax=Cyanophyceae TaxID=3028117 RepID=A0A0C1NCM1_9CYAN
MTAQAVLGLSLRRKLKERLSHPFIMTDQPIQNLNMTDTEYAALIAKGYDPALEQQLVELGENSDQARNLARFVGLLQDKPPETEDEWEELMEVWEEVCGYRPDLEQLRNDEFDYDAGL